MLYTDFFWVCVCVCVTPPHILQSLSIGYRFVSKLPSFTFFRHIPDWPPRKEVIDAQAIQETAAANSELSHGSDDLCPVQELLSPMNPGPIRDYQKRWAR